MNSIFNHNCWIYDSSLPKVIEMEKKKQENHYSKAPIQYPVAVYLQTSSVAEDPTLLGHSTTG